MQPSIPPRGQNDPTQQPARQSTSGVQQQMITIRGVRVQAYGPADNSEFFREWLTPKMNKYYGDLYLNFTELEPFRSAWDHEIIPSLAYILAHSRSLRMNETDPDSPDSRVIGELVARQLNKSLLVENCAIAKQMLTLDVLTLINSRGLARVTSKTQVNYAPDIVHFTARLAAEGLDIIGVPIDADWTVDANGISAIPSPEAAVRILVYISLYSTGTYKRTGIWYIAHTILSFLRQCSSPNFLNKIQDGIANEFGKQISLSQNIIRNTFLVYGSLINDSNMREVLSRWGANIPNLALRLMVIVAQTPGSRLSYIITIGRALKRYPDFDWAFIAACFPQEWGNLRDALAAFQGDPYYMYRRDLGPMKSTLYKSLGYVAKELHRVVGGAAHIDNYRGWPMKVRNKADIDHKIAAYERGKAAGVTNEIVNQHVSAVAEVADINQAVFTNLLA